MQPWHLAGAESNGIIPIYTASSPFNAASPFTRHACKIHVKGTLSLNAFAPSLIPWPPSFFRRLFMNPSSTSSSSSKFCVQVLACFCPLFVPSSPSFSPSFSPPILCPQQTSPTAGIPPSGRVPSPFILCHVLGHPRFFRPPPFPPTLCQSGLLFCVHLKMPMPTHREYIVAAAGLAFCAVSLVQNMERALPA